MDGLGRNRKETALKNRKNKNIENKKKEENEGSHFRKDDHSCGVDETARPNIIIKMFKA